MAQVKVNTISLSYAIESTPGVLPGTPTWKLLEPEDIGRFGVEVSKVARNPISKNRQRRKGAVVDLTSGVEFEADFTLEHNIDFLEGFIFSTFQGPAVVQAGANFETLVVSSATAYGHDALAAAIAEGALVYGRGFPTAANNGLKEVDSGSTTTSTPIVGGGLTVESPAESTGATLEVCGVRAATSDLAITVASGTATLTSTTLDFTTLSLTLGQKIHIGGLTTSEQFSAGAGYGRITALSANSMTLDRLDSALATDPGTGDTVDLLFGRFARNVDVDDADYIERTFQFEAAWPDLAGSGVDRYSYSLANRADTMAISLPLNDKASISFGFVGTDTNNPTGTRATNAATPVNPNQTAAFGTASDIARLVLRDSSNNDQVTCFKSLTLTLSNGVTPENCLGTLGATFVNVANFEVDFDAQALFTEESVIAAIRNNTTLGLDFILTNSDGAIAFDIPSLTLEGGDFELPRNESVIINVPGQAFGDATLDTSLSVSLFPVVPTS